MRMLARKLPFYLITFVIAITIDFFIPRLMPGNPLDAVLARRAASGHHRPCMRWRRTTESTPSKPAVPVRAVLGQPAARQPRHLHQLLPATVTAVIASALPWTIALVGAATVISFLLGTVLGVLVAWRRGTWLDSLLPVTTFFQAMPYFFLALLA